MREFNNQIDIAVIYGVDIITEQTVDLKTGVFWINVDANSVVKPSDKVKTKSAGNLYTQKLSVYVEKLSDTDKAKLPAGIKVIVKLHDDNGELIWGDFNIPCRISLSPGIQSDLIEITRTALVPFL